MDTSNTLTAQMTDADKSVRGKICYPFTQPLWWMVLPIRWAISRLAGFIFWENTRNWLWHKILTPANFLTSARIWLLVKAILAFFSGETIAYQTILLTIAIITDFFDGCLARNNNEVTELGTYLDHIGDWGIVIWVAFLNLLLGELSYPYLLFSLAVIPILLLIYIGKFRNFYDSEVSWLDNLSAFAMEELQTDFWGRLQFVLFVFAIFGGLFLSVSTDSNFILDDITRLIPKKIFDFAVSICLAGFIFFAGYNTRDAIEYSEAKIKKFREKLRSLKNAA